MNLSYYPGCTLKTRAKELDIQARKCAEALGITLQEICDWQCCGGCYPLASNEIAHRLSAARALKKAEAAGGEIVTVCSACHNVLKRCEAEIEKGEAFTQKLHAYLLPEEVPEGRASVLHYIEMLRDKVGFDVLAQKVKNPLTGRRIASYYGCLLLRPGKVMAFDDPENPRIMEDFVRALGAEPVIYPYRNECCGGYMTLENKDFSVKKSTEVVHSAASHGAECVITACPLCLYNLQKNSAEKLPVLYFTSLLAEALGIDAEEN